MTSTTPAPPRALSLADISLRDRERGFICGGTDSGKSTLMEQLAAEFLHRYRGRGARQLILDSKPRYRAEFTAHGLPAKRRYKSWAHGPLIPGSVVVDEPADLALAWRTGARTVIVQARGERGDVERLTATAKAFLNDSRASRPQLLNVDETLDFFHSNGAPRGGDDVLVRASTAGRERGTSAIYGAQRTHGIPPALMGMMSRLYAFRIDYVNDAKRYQEMGAPRVNMVPTRPHEFYYWWKGDAKHPEAYHRVYGPMTLNLG